MSTRIRHAGCGIGLIREVPVWHRRRVDLRRFFRQVYVFGMSRITLRLLYPDSLKAVHVLPALFVLGCIALILLSCFCFMVVHCSAGGLFHCCFFRRLVCDAESARRFYRCTCGCRTAWRLRDRVYKSLVYKILLRRGRDEQQEIMMRKRKMIWI